MSLARLFNNLYRKTYLLRLTDKLLCIRSLVTSAQPPDDNAVLYPGHIPTTLLQKSILAVGSAAMTLYDPARDDLLSALGETTGSCALPRIRARMMTYPEGREILQDKPLVNTETIDLNYLKSLGDDTFGKAYWNFLNINGFNPDARFPVRFVDDAELMYVMLRYRQIHDLVHTLLAMPPNMLGEVAVKWFEAIQTGLPMCALGAVFGPLRFGPRWRRKYLQLYLPWSIKSGRNADFLMAVYFEKYWETSIDTMRRDMNISPPPEKWEGMKLKKEN